MPPRRPYSRHESVQGCAPHVRNQTSIRAHSRETQSVVEKMRISEKHVVFLMILECHRSWGKHFRCQNRSFLEQFCRTTEWLIDTVAPDIPRFLPGDRIFDTESVRGCLPNRCNRSSIRVHFRETHSVVEKMRNSQKHTVFLMILLRHRSWGKHFGCQNRPFLELFCRTTE